MTDFLHVPPTPQPSSPVNDDLVMQKSESAQTVSTLTEPSEAHVTDAMDDASLSKDTSVESEGVKANASQMPSGKVSAEPIRRNFAASGKKISTPVEEQNANGEEVKRIVRKESPLFIHYYQSVFILLIALFVASGYFVLNPLISEFKQVNQMIRFRLEEKDSADAFLQSVNRSIAAAQSISPEVLSKINESLPKEAEIPILMKTFYQLADQNGVKMGGIQFSPQKAGSDSKTIGGYALAPIQISLSIQAPGYHIMRKYLEDLQLNIQLMDVKSISVSGDETGAFSYSLELTTYTIQKVVNVAPTSQAIPMGGAMAPPSAPKVTPNDI